VYGTSAVVPYLLSITSSKSLEGAFGAIAAHEQTLIDLLLTWLRNKYERGVRIVGAEEGGEDRVPTISFVVVGQGAMKSEDVVKVFDQKGGVSVATFRVYF
jgi:hypothetical protein